ncbi:MAG: hypothetical protein HOP19_15450, partial [Acidobacteria bacterium]|nr:hypothetical protein [Acidobacteriota bacterium]
MKRNLLHLCIFAAWLWSAHFASSPSFAAAVPIALPNGTVNQPYNAVLEGDGGVAPYSFALLSGTLPNGISFNNGTFSGTPLQPADVTLLIETTDTNGCTGAQEFSLTISTCPTLSLHTILPNGTIGTTYQQSVIAAGAADQYSFQVSFGTLPNGLALNAATGQLTGRPSVGGLYNFRIRATPSLLCVTVLEQAYTTQVVCPTITLSPNGTSPTSLPAGLAGVNYQTTISALAHPAGIASFTFSMVSGALPSGLSLNATTGTISGKTNFVGTSNFTIRATGLGGCFGQQAYRLVTNCPTIALGFAANPVRPDQSVALPNGTIGSAYNKSLAASPTGTTYLYSRTSGALPPGFSLNAMTGALTGTPTATGTFSFTLRAQGF